MSDNIREFELDLSRFIDGDVPEEVLRASRKLGLDVFASVTLETPVDTGRARANWMASAGEPSEEVLPEGSQPDPGAALGAFAQAKPYEPLWVSNNVPYIEALEDGHSQQKPAGMVGPTIARVKAAYEAEG